MGRRKNEKFYKDYTPYFCVNNNDSNLRPIYISLPSPPRDRSKIAGFGLHPDDQYFRREVIPEKLSNLGRSVLRRLEEDYARDKTKAVTGYKIILEFWKELEENKDYYEKEIDFIRRVWWHIFNGYFFYNDGEITYISGWYYHFLNFWKIRDIGYPEYREKDRLKYLYWKYLYECKETFANIDDDGFPIRNQGGDYDMTDVGFRLFFGGVEPKTRRSGATEQGCHQVNIVTSTGTGRYGTIVSMEGDNAEKIYKKSMITGWNAAPIWLKPIWRGDNNPSAIRFSSPANKFDVKVLDSIIDYTKSAGEKKLDGDKIHAAIFDEEGKTTVAQIFERWNVNKLAMSTGGGVNIIGWCTHPSTVEEMNEGGEEYRKLCDMSNFYNRIPNKGQTQSGLGLCFFPAQDGLEGFIDRFGKSVIDEPSERQILLRPDAAFAKLRIGAKQYLNDERQSLLKDGSPQAMEKYRSLRRKAPMEYAECWIGQSGEIGFNTEKLDNRISELQFRPQTIKGNFKWVTGKTNEQVVFVRDDENGRFDVSELFESSSNRYYTMLEWDPIDGENKHVRYPKYPNRFMAGGDPFKFSMKRDVKETGKGMSDGGFAIFWNHDPSVDQSTNMSSWESYRFVCTYRSRPKSDDDFAEDCLMACFWYSTQIFPETNHDLLVKHFIKRGYGGYLKYSIDPVSGKSKDKPGVHSLETSKDKLFSLLRSYIEHRAHKEKHLKLLLELRQINSKDEMKKYDLLTAAGLALMGIENSEFKEIGTFDKAIDIYGIMKFLVG